MGDCTYAHAHASRSGRKRLINIKKASTNQRKNDSVCTSRRVYVVRVRMLAILFDAGEMEGERERQRIKISTYAVCTAGKNERLQMSVEQAWERTRRAWSNVYRSTSAVSFSFSSSSLHSASRPSFVASVLLTLPSSHLFNRISRQYLHTHAHTCIYIQSSVKDDAKGKFIYSNDLKSPVSTQRRCWAKRTNENAIDHIARASRDHRLVSNVIKTYVQVESHDCSNSHCHQNRSSQDYEYCSRLNSHADQLSAGGSMRISTRKEHVWVFLHPP